MATSKTTTKPDKEAPRVPPVPHKINLPAELDNRLRNLVDAEQGPPHRLRLAQVFKDAIEREVSRYERAHGGPYPQRTGP